ncbi:MAG: tryptophan-rich sensory protein [Ignavibacteria bacterium]|nr:tryptophan-rich sensory protein [Ignavibacteria bacterium]
MKNFFRLIISILICQSAGIIGSFFTVSSVGGWYQTLNKPSFNPPGYIFGPVWITLYLLMGISLYLIWNKKDIANIKFPVILFSVQLFFNTIWSIIFFGLQNPLVAFFDILLLLIFLILTVISFYKVSKPASLLLIPYLLWVSFATILNYSIVKLN